jgi:hypothetical protein
MGRGQMVITLKMMPLLTGSRNADMIPRPGLHTCCAEKEPVLVRGALWRGMRAVIAGLC